MSVSEGSRLGAYRILAPLGVGGMGEVYRATDTRLKRQVAVKILPAMLAADPDRLARFQREAEVLASLNHPHIAAIYGLEDADGVKALVMELVEGPTLADRIAQGSIPLDEALPIARQIAQALEAAHEQGIVHRDLKPANIKVRSHGSVKVLDFGLAKLSEGTGRGEQHDSSQAPTAMTEIGMILGTAAYMSPEQARGRAVDKRTDIWAFGAVLYEMLTGVRAFDGEDVTEIMASVVKTTPNWTTLGADVPGHVVTLIQRCLEKDRNARIGDIAVARFLLSEQAPVGDAVVAVPASPPAPRRRQMIGWVLAAVLAGTLLGWLLPRRTAVVPRVTHLQMGVRPAEHLVGSIASVRPARTAMAISPDGQTVVFTATRGDVTQLFVRALDRADATPLAGTEGAGGPFFSPDGAWIGFWSGNTIKKLPLAGGPPAVVAEVPARDGAGASWGEDGSIFFEGDTTGISKVSADGGPPATVIPPDTASGERHLLPHALPGGTTLLLTTLKNGDWDTAAIAVQSIGSMASNDRRVLIPGATDARYVHTGHLLYMKAGTLMGVPFDARSQQVTGTAVALIENVMHGINAPNTADETGAGQFTVSRSGTLLYVLGGISPVHERSLVWVDRSGAAQPLAAAPSAAYFGPRLSPDGQKLAVSVRRGARGSADLWVYDVIRGAPTRLTFEGGGLPVWSPDGRRMVYGSATDGTTNLHMISASGGGKPERLVPSEFAQLPSSWSPGANTLVFLQRPRSGVYGIFVLPMDGDPKPRLFLESPFRLWHPTLSADGRWMAYTSYESGASEVYVQPYPGPGEKTRVSTAGGIEPMWSPNSSELFFRGHNEQQVFSAAVSSLSPFRIDTPRLLFEAKPGDAYDSTAPDRSWDVSADGQRFLLQRPVDLNDRPVTTLHIVLNWSDELKRRVP